MTVNPIAFAVDDSMTMSQVRRCAETLRVAFYMLERGADDADIVAYLEQSRDQLFSLWGAPK